VPPADQAQPPTVTPVWPSGSSVADCGLNPPNVPGYEILAVLGRGGMGVVYKARQVKLRRVVALKMILAGGHATSGDLDRFRIEAESIARLQHPNIVQIHEVGEHDGLPYFSLEFCDGGSLEKKLGGTPLPPGEAASLIEKLGRAMQAAHDKGVIHRDLKPGNVLLAEDGTAKITDFGLAKKLDEGGKTQTGSIMGTPSYMAPEQAGGKTEKLGPACDIYALGTMLYECLTGRPPFRAATPLDTVMQVLSEEPVPLRHLNARVPPDLETICLKCLQKEASRRYPTAAALADDLRRYQSGEPILARPVGTPERLWRWCKRKPALATASAVAIVGVLLTLGTFAGAFFVVRESLENETQERKKAEKLAEDNKKLADENGLLAAKETKAREEADERRERAEELALQVGFNHFYSQATADSALALVGTAQLLPKAASLKNRSL